MTVGEYLEAEKIDEDFIESKFDGPYWESCDRFISRNWRKDVELLSKKQFDWLLKIREDCTEKRLERK